MLEDDFATGVDPAKWAEQVAAAGGVQYITPDEAGWLVSWELPDDGFILQIAPNLTTPIAWTDSTVVPISLGPTRRQASIPKNQLPEGNQAYFRMIKPQ